MIFSKLFGKYWLLQCLIIGVFVLYIGGMSLGVTIFVTSFQSNNEPKGEVEILLIIESSRPSNSFNYSYRSIVLANTTLIEHLNNTIGRDNWDGKYGQNGWYITRIFNATEESNWHWFIYYRSPYTSTWNSAPVGVSSFRLNRDYEIKLIFEKT